MTCFIQILYQKIIKTQGQYYKNSRNPPFVVWITTECRWLQAGHTSIKNTRFKRRTKGGWVVKALNFWIWVPTHF